MPSLYSSKTSTGWQLRADYSTSQEIANNRTLFSVDLYVYAGTSGSYNSNTSASLSAYYTIYGERKYQPYNFPTTGWKYLGSRSFYISHNADGTKTFTFTADWYSRNATSYTPASVSISTSITLPTIPRASSISAGSFTIGSSGTITINRASSAFTHTLSYSFGNASGTIGTNLGTSAIWTPPTSLLSQVPTQTSKICTITCTTYSGGTAIGTYSINVTLYVASGVVPSISEVTISPVNTNSWINEKDLYVGGFTKARIQTKATAGQGASIKSITVNGTSASDDWTSPILTAGQKSFMIRVTDTRGRYVEENVSALFLEYTQPLFVTAKAVRSDALGLEIDDGTYLYAIGEVTHSSLDGNNQVQLKLRIRTSGGEWQQFVNIENNEAYIQEGLLLTASYEVEIVATDLVGSNVTRLFRIATASIDFHLRHGGRGAAFGKYSEIEGLEVDWNARFYKDVEVDGKVTTDGIEIDITEAEATEINTLLGTSGIKRVATLIKDISYKVKDIAYKLGLIADYVVEQKNVGKLNYKKWNNGLIEAWFEKVDLDGTLMAVNFMGGYLFYRDIQNIPSGLFKTITTIDADGHMGTGVGWGLGVAYSTTSIRIYICGNQNDANMHLLSCKMKGTWK